MQQQDSAAPEQVLLFLSGSEGGDNERAEEWRSVAALSQSDSVLLSVCQHGPASVWIIDRRLSAADPLFSLFPHQRQHR